VTDNSCAKCGACTAVCPVYQNTGQESLTARGRLHLLDKLAGGKPSAAFLDIFSKCLLCGACRQVCPRNIDLAAKVVALRHNSPQANGQGAFAQALVKGCLSHQPILAGVGKFLKISAPLLAQLPADSGLRLKLGLAAAEQDSGIPPGHAPPRQAATDVAAKSMLFPGCFARHLRPDITAGAAALIAGKGTNLPGIPTGQGCCGLAFYSSGDLTKARHLARVNIAAFEGTDLPIVVACGSCFSHLTGYAELLADDDQWRRRAGVFTGRLRELSAFLAGGNILAAGSAAAPENPAKQRVFYHDPCHLRYQPDLKKAPRQLLGRLAWVELTELPNGPQCCGLGGLFNLAHPDISGRIAGKLINDIMTVAPDLVVTTCSGCLIQLRRHLAAAGSPAQVLHLAQLLPAAQKVPKRGIAIP
jgi:glycolate oxidase iron-sulfur subunit